jgi:translation initiation factor 1
MSEANPAPKSLLFLSKNENDFEQARNRFNTEAQKMEVFWIAKGTSINADPATILADLQGADLTILLKYASDTPMALSKPNKETETWIIPAPSDLESILEQNIKTLLIRLILKGGKRQPVNTTGPSGVSSRGPSGGQSGGPAGRTSAGQAGHASAPRTGSPNANTQSAARVYLDSKGRGGKKVSVVSGLVMDETALSDLTTKLKKVCGTGGTLKDGCIEIQGDHRDQIMSELQRLGYKPKRSGG